MKKWQCYFLIFFGVYVRERYDQSFKSQEMGHIQMYLSYRGLRVKFKLFSLSQQTYFEFSEKIIGPIQLSLTDGLSFNCVLQLHQFS